jgi:hypothetical protein
MIVLNGMPFLPFNLRALYPFAHQIIVVEGAVAGAAAIADPRGHSRDGTLEELRRFAQDEDPDGKLVVVTAEDAGRQDGFWPGEKDEQSRAYAERATGDYLWQVDVDEFYLPQEMRKMIDYLGAHPETTAVTFPMVPIWGDLHCMVDGWYLRRGAGYFHRLFKWGPGYVYARHRPPTVLDGQGRDTRSVCWLDGPATARLGVHLLHYALLFPAQVREKVEYYSSWGLYGDWNSEIGRWMEDSYLTLRRPFRVHNEYHYVSWLRRYEGEHPPEIRRMMHAIAVGGIPMETRPMADAQRLLRSRVYAALCACLRAAEPVDRRARVQYRRGRAAARRIVHRVRAARDGR